MISFLLSGFEKHRQLDSLYKKFYIMNHGRREFDEESNIMTSEDVYKVTVSTEEENSSPTVAVMDLKRDRFPFCIVWTPIPVLTWLFPIIGHMGICYSTGVIRDFAGPYVVTEDNMAFGRPTKYWELNPDLVVGGKSAWDRAIYEASEEYKTRMHNLCCDNCHSHCAYALNLMKYKGSSGWNMVWLALDMLLYGKYIGLKGVVKTWLPFLLICTIVITFCLVPFQLT